MMKRQADEEGAAVANLGSVPGRIADHSIARKAATAKSRTKALARRLRKSSRMASLTAEISEGIEQIAGYSDGIIESFEESRQLMDRIVNESREGAEYRRTLSEVSVETRTSSGETAAALGEMSFAFSRHEESLRRILSLIQAAAQTQNDIQKKVQELSRLNGSDDTITGCLNRLLERADISGLNAVLESGRAGESGAGFGLVAAMVRKTAAAFELKAAEATGFLDRIKETHGSLYAKTAGTAERIQAIGVMTKGVRNAFTEAEGVIAELCADADEIADRTRIVIEDFDGDSPSMETVLEIVERASGSIDMATARLSEQEHQFAEAADRAEQLLASTGRLASTDDLPGALDTIYTDTDTFIRSIETTLERLDLSLASIHTAAHDAEQLRSGSGIGDGNATPMFETAKLMRDAALRLRNRTTSLRETLGAALTVLGNVARELALLGEESEAVGGEVAALRPLYRGISRLAGQAGAFSGRMDLLAVTGGMEVTRAGEAGAGFSALPGEFETAAADAAELEQTVSSLCDRLDDCLHDMANSQGKLDWRGLGESFNRLITGMQDLLESRLAIAEEKGVVLADALTDFNTRIERVREMNVEVEHAVAETVRVIGEAGTSGENQRTVFRHTIATAEKISTLADELYPEEE